MSDTHTNPSLEFDASNDTPSPLPQTPATESPSSTQAQPDQDGYPPQRHAGKVGYGPEYGRGVGMGEKITGLKEEAKGKILRKPEVVEHGHQRRTGELKRKEQDDVERSAFADAQEKQASTAEVGEGPHTDDQDRARENVRVV